MNLRQCLENLRYDINNGGLEDDTFAINCYITMANEARRLLKSGALNQQLTDQAKEYLSLCSKSNSGSLRCVAEG